MCVAPTAWLSLLIASPKVIQQKVAVRRGDPPKRNLRVMQELKAFMELHHMEYSKAIQSTSDDTPIDRKTLNTRRYLFKQAWEKMLEVRNGSLASDTFDAWILDDGSAVTVAMVVTKLASSFKDTVFRAMPGKPEEGKWTKLGPSLGWWVAFKMLGAARVAFSMAAIAADASFTAA